MAGRAILERGLKLRVGDGSSIMISDNNWIPSFYGTSLNFPRSILPSDATVNGLFLNMNGVALVWNSALTAQIFPPEMVRAICDIPLPIVSSADSWFWDGTCDGHYFVKT